MSYVLAHDLGSSGGYPIKMGNNNLVATSHIVTSTVALSAMGSTLELIVTH